MATKEVNLNGVDYTVRELTIGEVLPIMPRLGNGDDMEPQLELIEICVLADGQALDSVGARALPFSVFLKLISEVMEVNGMGAEDEKKP